MQHILDTNDSERNFDLNRSNKAALVVNNLGALSVSGLGAVVSEVFDQLRTQYSVNAVRVYSGTSMTSLDGAGFSISLLSMVETGVKESLTELLNASCNAVG